MYAVNIFRKYQNQGCHISDFGPISGFVIALFNAFSGSQWSYHWALTYQDLLYQANYMEKNPTGIPAGIGYQDLMLCISLLPDLYQLILFKCLGLPPFNL